MPEFAPLFEGNVLPKNTSVLPNRLVKNGLNATTIGAAAGVATSVNKARVAHPPARGGDGKQVIENESLINRNSTAADVTEMKRIYTRKKPAFGFVRDLSGNGGGAFTRG